ncbi:MFS transporter [Herbinix luporum]|uniref:MFS transporter n=1 Tax=Herbinix luporum TaxID=1679721 RepID=UPI0017573BB7|nr:MFS transporter [Herbinix luporum]HHT57463.1 MFS transporter [Herbinix luporum]
MNFKLMKQKDFSLLILGKLVSLVGSNMQQFALSLYVLEITGSATIFASILSVSILPRLLLSPIAGVFGDWFNRKKTIVLLDFINGIILGIFALIYITSGSLTVFLICILVILLEITEIFFNSAMSAVLPSLVKKDQLMEANSLNSLVMNIGNVLSPIIAAILYDGLGIKAILILSSISFVLSAISELFIKIPNTHKKPEKISIKAFKTDLMEGIDIIRSNRLISTMIGLGTIINFSIGPLFGIGLIYISKEVLKVSDMQFGFYQMVLSASMLLAPLICGGIIKKIKIGRLTHISFTVIAVLIFVMSILPSSIFLRSFNSNMVSYIGLLIISFIVGLVVTVANIALGTLFNQVVPLELMGRTSTVYNLAVTVFIPVGQMIFGILYDIINPSVVIIISGFILMIAIALYKKTLLSYDERELESEFEA